MMDYLRRQIFFKLNQAIGCHCEDCYNEMFVCERMKKDELRSFQDERLQKLLRYAVAHIPFYKERVLCREKPDLLDFPILTKKGIRTQFLNLMSVNLRKEYQGQAPLKSCYSWIEAKTGGSTGVPITVIHCKDFRDFDRAARLYAQFLSGFVFGTPYFRLWGSMKDINQMKDSFYHRLMGWLAGERIMNAFRMEKHHMNEYLDQINNSRINHMMGYVDALYQLALHAQCQSKAVRTLKSVMACAGTVTEDARHIVEDVFSARVHNKYGSRDCGDMACECDQGGMHIFSNRYFIEVVDEAGNQVTPKLNGKILVTVLGNYDFPIIRYDIGDVGSLSELSCPCGRSFPLLNTLEGRSIEFLNSIEGGYVSPSYIIHLIGVIHNPGFIEKFQLIQETESQFVLKLKLESNVTAEQTKGMKKNILIDLIKVLGDESQIIFKYVDS